MRQTICDRCGKIVKPKCSVQKTPTVTITYEDFEGYRLYPYESECDICWDCLNELYEWFKRNSDHADV